MSQYKYQKLVLRENNNHKVYFDILDTFYKMALAMRGWQVNGHDNIKEIITGDCNHINDIDINQHDTDDITNFVQMSENYGQQRCKLFDYQAKYLDLFMNVPLYNYINKHLKPIRDPTHGLSIGQRIEICTDSNNVNACLRFTSNIYLYTYYFYIKLLNPDYPTDFEPKQVHWIS